MTYDLGTAQGVLCAQMRAALAMKFRVLKKFCLERPPKSVVRLGLARGDLWWANLDRKPVGPILA
jgi:hypothetical protein